MNASDTRFKERNLKFTEDVEITNGNLSNNLCNSFRTKNQNMIIALINFVRSYRYKKIYITKGHKIMNYLANCFASKVRIKIRSDVCTQT